MKNDEGDKRSVTGVTNRINWYPGHMAKALRQIREYAKRVDLILEVRDARAPIASGNPLIQQISSGKPRLIALNKVNLVDTTSVRQWEKWFNETEQEAIFINSLDWGSLKKLTKRARELLKSRRQAFEKKGIRPPPMRMIILGIPNTGKSTIINRLTRRNAAKTGDRPGVTRSHEWIVLNKDLELLDTPGIMPPRIATEEQGKWLCAIHSIKDEILGREKVAMFVVRLLIQRQSFDFQQRYRLSDLDAGAEEVILRIGGRLNYKKKGGEIDFNKTCGRILHDFRRGILGSCCFELPPSMEG